MKQTNAMKMQEKIDAIFGQGNWRMTENILHVYVTCTTAQRAQLHALMTYTGEDIEVREDATQPVTTRDEVVEPPHHSTLLYVNQDRSYDPDKLCMDMANASAMPWEPTEWSYIHEAGYAINAGIDVMLTQRTKGKGKYGVAIEDAGLSADQLCEHAQQEMADGLVYTSELRAQIQRDLQKARNEVAAEILAIVENESKNPEMRLAIIADTCKKLADGTRCKTLYAQAGLLANFNNSDVNLLTLSRVGDSLVYRIPVKVIA